MQIGQLIERMDSFLRFNPFLVEYGILQAKGRQRYSLIPRYQDQPIIMDIRDHVTQLIVKDDHTNCCQHIGKDLVRAYLQQTFVKIGLQKFLQKVSQTCFICRRWRAENVTTIMSDFPRILLAGDKKQHPFITVGVYHIRTFYIDINSHMLDKLHICMFTCLVTRAEHLEICHSLDAYICLLAIRLFVLRRRYPELMLSDHRK